VTIESLVRRLSVIVFLLTLASTVATVHRLLYNAALKFGATFSVLVFPLDVGTRFARLITHALRADQSVLVHVHNVELAVAVLEVKIDSRPRGGVAVAHLGIDVPRPIRRIEAYPIRQCCA
jgi:hypothetical protein